MQERITLEESTWDCVCVGRGRQGNPCWKVNVWGLAPFQSSKVYGFLRQPGPLDVLLVIWRRSVAVLIQVESRGGYQDAPAFQVWVGRYIYAWLFGQCRRHFDGWISYTRFSYLFVKESGEKHQDSFLTKTNNVSIFCTLFVVAVSCELFF